MIKSTVKKVVSRGKPQVGREGYPAGAYNKVSQKGHDITFLPKKGRNK